MLLTLDSDEERDDEDGNGDNEDDNDDNEKRDDMRMEMVTVSP